MIQQLYLQVSGNTCGQGSGEGVGWSGSPGWEVTWWGLCDFQAWGSWGRGNIVSYCPVCPQPGAQLEQPASIADDDLVQATFQQLQNPPSPARPHLLRDTVKQLMLRRERLSLVTGQSGQGKTAFLVRSPRALGGRKGALCGRRKWAPGSRAWKTCSRFLFASHAGVSCVSSAGSRWGQGGSLHLLPLFRGPPRPGSCPHPAQTPLCLSALPTAEAECPPHHLPVCIPH